MLKKILSTTLIGAFIASTFAVAGCNTVQGAGKDVEKGGEKIQKEAAEHKKY
jgi:predicted small secreted protein